MSPPHQSLETVQIKALLAFIVPALSLPLPSGLQGGVWGLGLTIEVPTGAMCHGSPPCTHCVVPGQGLPSSALQHRCTRAEPLHGYPHATTALCCRGSLLARGALPAAMPWGGHAGCIIRELLVPQLLPGPHPIFSCPPRPPFTTKPTPCSPAARCPPRPSPRRWAAAVPTVPSWLFLPHLTHGRFPRAPPWLRSPPPTPARPAAVPVAHLQIQRRGTFKRERRGGASPRTLIYHELMCFSHLFLCTAPGCALPRAHTRRAPVRSRSVSVSHAWPGLSRRRTARSDRRERAAEQDGEYTLSRHVTLTMCIHS